jgi:zinc transport system permease protein
VLSEWLDDRITWFTSHFSPYSFFGINHNVTSLIAVVLVALVCGTVGALVVGNRMAFFSDALAHCAFAGISLGFLLALAAGVKDQTEFSHWITPVMVVFGILVGLGIDWVRERSGLSSDTVIGVFFAGAIGFGAIILRLVSERRYFQPENFLFGSPSSVSSTDILQLVGLLLLTGFLLARMYNQLVLSSFNPSLALSRGVRVRLCNATFIVLLALVVNLCLQTVGALLINAMLVVPAATAANLCRNMRQLFWSTVGLCLLVGLAGQALSWNLTVAASYQGGERISFDVGGIMVVLSVLLFFASLILRPWLRRN